MSDLKKLKESLDKIRQLIEDRTDVNEVVSYIAKGLSVSKKERYGEVVVSIDIYREGNAATFEISGDKEVINEKSFEVSIDDAMQVVRGLRKYIPSQDISEIIDAIKISDTDPGGMHAISGTTLSFERGEFESSLYHRQKE